MVDFYGSEEAGKQQLCDSSSTWVGETVDGSHLLRIKGYSLARGLGTGEFIKSETFEAGGYNWAIKFYPSVLKDDRKYVSVFVELTTEGTTVSAVSEFKLLSQSGKGDYVCRMDSVRKFQSGVGRGYVEFFNAEDLQTSDYIKDDCLSIQCKVGVVKTRIDVPEIYAIPILPSDMSQSLKGLLESGLGHDIVFHVGNETFKAHKSLLAARSPVFKAQFFGLVGNPDMDIVIIEDVEPSVFKAMLHFIYTDALPGAHDITDSTVVCTSTNMAQDLLAAADRFCLDRLKSLCEAKLGEDINAETVATTLALSEKHQCSKLKKICLKFMATPQNLGVAVKSEGYVHLKEFCPSLLAELVEAIALVDGEYSGFLLNRKRIG